jgi:hypothetical protein
LVSTQLQIGLLQVNKSTTTPLQTTDAITEIQITQLEKHPKFDQPKACAISSESLQVRILPYE